MISFEHLVSGLIFLRDVFGHQLSAFSFCGDRGGGLVNPQNPTYMDTSAGIGSVVKPLNPRVKVPVAALQLMAWTWGRRLRQGIEGSSWRE